MNKLSNLLILTLLIAQACGSPEELNNEAKVNDPDAEASARYDALLADKLNAFQPLPKKADNPNNPESAAKIKLGHILYYDTRLSKDGNNSCNSCHNLSTYGVDHLPTSPGDLGKNGDRNSPTTLNAALHFKQFWDGRAEDVEEQAGGPVLNPVEMNIPSKAFMEQRLKDVLMYQRLFAEAFPESSSPITYDNMQRAIGVFERQLLTPSRFDAYLQGKKEALTLQEKKGLLSFVLVGCVTCHSGSLLGGDQFQRFGVHGPYWEATGSGHIDKGLAQVTGEEMDEYLFKVPSLRNISETHPYFHDGSVSELEKAVKIMAELQLDYRLNKEELENIVAFMEALKGEVPAKYQEDPLAVVE